MKSWPLGVKIGAGVAVVLLTLVMWLSWRRQPDEVARPQRPAPRSQRVHDRLAQLRGSRGGRVESGQADSEFRARALPGGRVALRPEVEPELEVPATPSWLDDEPDLETLKQMVTADPDPDKRLMAVMLLGGSEDPAAVPVLAQALGDENEDVRLAAVEMLGDFEGDEPVEAIQAALDDASAEIRFEALGVLADRGGEVTLAAVQRALSDEDDDVRALAEGVLDMEHMYQQEPAGGGARPGR
ncbi:MAG: HEAT repeat domain-containing protein [Deltaproteobacteria bacterium]|nr:HEAT repeat domain-containing protein [Deltaproteobacteria bacterium]